MTKKMISFLQSIGISNPESFDLDFVLVARNAYKKEQVDMAIEKSTPWDYALLEQFISALGTIRYPYTLRLSYENQPTEDDVYRLFLDWYMAHYYAYPTYLVGMEHAGKLVLGFGSLEEKKAEERKVTEFESLLSFINYDVAVERQIPEPEPEPVVEEDVEDLPDLTSENNEISISMPDLNEYRAVPNEKPEEAREEDLAAEMAEEPAAPVAEPAQEPDEHSIEELEPAEEAAEEQQTAEPEPLQEASFEDAVSDGNQFEPVYSEAEVEAEAANAPEESDAEPEISSIEQAREIIAAEQQAQVEAGEAELIEIMKQNLAAYEEEKKRQRVWKKGDYKIIDSIEDIYGMEGENVDFAGIVFEANSRLTRKGKMSATLGLGDAKSAINARVFENARLTAAFLEGIKPGQRFRVRGAIDEDRFSNQKTIMVHFLDLLPPAPLREDPEEEKRVELHLHTNMSVMDALPEMLDYCKLAKNMGMKAIAITDHGVVQGFPAAQDAAKKTGLKMIYGVELYMFDIDQTYILNPCNTPLKTAKYVVFDTETTGLSSRYDRIIEFGGVMVEGGRVTKTLSLFIDPEMPLPPDSAEVNHITEDDIKGAPTFAEAWPKIKEFLGDNILVAHNATFDVGFLNASLKRIGLEPISNPVIDTLPLSRYLFPEAGRHNEGALLKNLGLNVYNEREAHRAEYDARALSDGWLEIIVRLEKEHPDITHADLAALSIPPADPNDPDPEHKKVVEERYHSFCRHMREYHATVLVKNQAGLSDLYRVISESHVKYFSRIPRTPRSLLNAKRDNFLIGSGCFNGEIFELAMTREIDDLAKAMEFYDYIELQPVENYSYLIGMGRIREKAHLMEVLSDIVEAARIAGKPVVATGDCHYLNPEDKILRDVFIQAKPVGGGAHPMNPPGRAKKPQFDNPDQHFRSTREMLDSFMQWTDEESAREFVIKNTNLIADMIQDDIIPISDDLFPPNANLPDSAEKLSELCYSNFEKRYGGNNDPDVQARVAQIKARLDQELHGIIGHGYSVTYYIAHILIKMAKEEPEHYIVGSRGSVGSSFAATMADITEVNPLPPHYQCPHCHYLEWGDTSKYKSGFDLPDKVCPQCGCKMIQNGQNIPFETFLGYGASKVPDIDLNFEEESQHKAHNYTKVLLGEQNVFRAGTIETVAAKTAYGYVRGYFEFLGKPVDEMPPAYLAYIASRCVGVKRTTGQHPGGIVVVPSDKSVYDFTAIQHPADDMESEWLTTHYDYTSMHDEILKFDILGHVDPMAMRYYRDLTGVKIEDIPMNDERVLSLFTSPQELNLKSNWLGLQTGAAALPEFGTDLAQRMLLTAAPKCFNDLLVISGLAHGTNVWSGNAEDLLTNHVTDINGVIGCRDDIMTYLISVGIDDGIAFKIMEDVRKGRKLKPEYVTLMQEHKVPEYYIESCNKIHYLFPRGHATAYVMMAVRVAYFKLYYPLEFYAVFFSIRSDDWDIKAMIEGEDAIKARIIELRKRQNDRENPLKPKEVNILKTLQISLEMLERGYHFENIDLYRSDAKMFVVDHENKALIPPFSVIDGLGLNAAQSIVDARSDGRRFLSKEDLLKRASKLNGTNLADLDKLGVLSDLGDTNQMSLFEFM